MLSVMVVLPIVIGIASIVVSAIIAIAIQAVRQTREGRFRAEDRTAREKAAQAEAARDRERRISFLISAYVPNVVRVGGEEGAIRAGVLSLHDWSEVRDFCDRAAEQVPRDKPIPDVRRNLIPDERLLEYFQRLAKIENWTMRQDWVNKLIEDLSEASSRADAGL